MQRLLGAGDEQRMRDRDIDRGRAGRPRQPRGLRHRLAGASHVVQDHDRAAAQLDLGQLDRHRAVAMAHLAADGAVVADALGGLADPLAGLLVGTQQQGARALARDPVGQRRRTADPDRVRDRNRLAQRRDPVQVRVDRDHGIEQLGQEGADDALADHLARRKRHVLPHIGQIGRDQRQVARAELACAARHQQQLDQLLVGLLQAAQQHDALGQLRRQLELELAVRKAVPQHGNRGQAGFSGQARGHHGLVFEI